MLARQAQTEPVLWALHFWANPLRLQILSLLACLAVIAMAVSGILMWARRRGTRRLAVPPLNLRGTGLGLAIILALFAFLLPVFGASLVLVLLAEQLATHRARQSQNSQETP